MDLVGWKIIHGDLVGRFEFHVSLFTGVFVEVLERKFDRLSSTGHVSDEKTLCGSLPEHQGWYMAEYSQCCCLF